MKAVVFDKELKLVTNHPVPSRKGDEVLVGVSLAGICNTDLELMKGYMGFSGVFGHEFVGVVEEAPEGQGDFAGKRVTGEINLYCGECATCRAGMPTHCPNRSVLGILNKDGAMAEYLTLPARNLHVVPDGVPDEEAVFTEPLAAAFEILEQVHLRPTDRALVMGDGKLGLLCAQVLGLSQAAVTLLGKHPDKLSIATARGVGAALLNEFKAGREFDVVVEATGTAEGFRSALGYVRPRGTIVLKSTVAQAAELNLAPVVIDEISVVGSRCGPFEPALRSLEKKLIDVRPMISAVYPVDDALAAFEHAKRKGVLKVLVKFS
jgi:threonine dehydrogenase-like Zn-dependent dehydrogenase